MAQHLLTPESAVDIQAQLGSDVAMVLDECLAFPATQDEAARSMARSLRWAARCRARLEQIRDGQARDVGATNPGQAQFGIVQGGVSPELREESARGTVAVGFEAYAIGGLSVGEPTDVMYDMVARTTPCLPDDRPRSVDAIEVARLSKARRMRAIVLKNHYDPTAALAHVVRGEVPGIEVFGGIDLNLTVGGINPYAVEHMAKVTGGWGKIVWMSTFDAENQVRYAKENRPSVDVSKNGELLPEVKQVIALIATYGLVLATGHVSALEALMLLREGR